jgi:hypothetical protein
VGRGITTVAAASVVAAVAFAAYATGSVGVVTGAVDGVLVRSEKPKPKQPWERTHKNREPAPKPGSSAPFGRQTEESSESRSKSVSSGSAFERVLEQRAAAQAARRAELRKRLAQSDQPAADHVSNHPFARRVEAEEDRAAKRPAKDYPFDGKPAKSKKQDPRPFEKRVEGQ